jgi:hypothetical protein
LKFSALFHPSGEKKIQANASKKSPKRVKRKNLIFLGGWLQAQSTSTFHEGFSHYKTGKYGTIIFTKNLLKELNNIATITTIVFDFHAC